MINKLTRYQRMREISPDILTRYNVMLKKRSVPSGLHSNYLKWLRYYLDFCSKYNLLDKSSKTLPLFLKKLKDKKQTEEQQKQAGHAVSILLDMEKDTAKSTPSNITPVIVQPPAINPYSTLPSKKQEGFRTSRNDRGSQQSNPNNKRKPSPVAADAKTLWQKAIAELTVVIKTKHYSVKTLRSYCHWAWKLQTFRKTMAPASLGTEDVKAFLSWLAVSCKVSASSQNQAFNAILFFFRHVLKKEFGEIRDAVRAKRKPYIPVVLSREEVSSVIRHLYPPYDIIVKTMYGCGLRLFECIKLRVHNFNFDAGVLTIHDGKGQKDRTVPLPQSIRPELMAQIERLKSVHDRDIDAGYSGVFLDHLLEKKYKNAAREFIWQWFFPQKTLTIVEGSGEKRRYHIHESHVQKAIRAAVFKAKLTKRDLPIPSATASQLIFYRRITTSARYRHCSATAM